MTDNILLSLNHEFSTIGTVDIAQASVLHTKVTDFDPAAMDGIAERLWQKMFCFPVLVVCAYCESINAITNGTCLHCNGPLGNAKKYIGGDK